MLLRILVIICSLLQCFTASAEALASNWTYFSTTPDRITGQQQIVIRGTAESGFGMRDELPILDLVCNPSDKTSVVLLHAGIYDYDYSRAMRDLVVRFDAAQPRVVQFWQFNDDGIVVNREGPDFIRALFKSKQFVYKAQWYRSEATFNLEGLPELINQLDSSCDWLAPTCFGCSGQDLTRAPKVWVLYKRERKSKPFKPMQTYGSLEQCDAAGRQMIDSDVFQGIFHHQLTSSDIKCVEKADSTTQ